MRGSFAVAIACLALAGCFDRHEPPVDAGPRDGAGVYLACDLARDDFAVGAECEFTGSCERPGPCCTETWRCAGGVVERVRDCTETCWRSCSEALERAAEGDPCEGSFDCTAFDDTLCCARSVLCASNRISIDESCTPDCP